MELTAAMIILGNVVGYVLGIECAELIHRFLTSMIAVHAVSTFLTTEVMGQSALWLGKYFYRLQKGRKSEWAPRLTWLVATGSAIFLFRFSFLAFGRNGREC